MTIQLGLARTIKIRAHQAPYPALAVTKDVNIKQIAAAATTRLLLQRSLLLNQRRSHLNLQQNLLIHTRVTIQLGLARTIKIRAHQAPYPALAVTKDVNIKQIAAAATTRLLLQRSLLLNQRRSHLNLQQNLLIHTRVTIQLGLARTIKIRAHQAPYPALGVTKDVNIKQIAAAATTRLLHQVSYRH